MFRSKKTGRFVKRSYARRYPSRVSLVRRIRPKGYTLRVRDDLEKKLQESRKTDRRKNYFSRKGMKKVIETLSDIKTADEMLVELLPSNYLRLLEWTLKNEPKFFTLSERRIVYKALRARNL